MPLTSNTCTLHAHLDFYLCYSHFCIYSGLAHSINRGYKYAMAIARNSQRLLIWSLILVCQGSFVQAYLLYTVHSHCCSLTPRPGSRLCGSHARFWRGENWLGRYSFNPVNKYLIFTKLIVPSVSEQIVACVMRFQRSIVG